MSSPLAIQRPIAPAGLSNIFTVTGLSVYGQFCAE
jgi:hypothetical protein